jgi:hypothetical protein
MQNIENIMILAQKIRNFNKSVFKKSLRKTYVKSFSLNPVNFIKNHIHFDSSLRADHIFKNEKYFSLFCEKKRNSCALN